MKKLMLAIAGLMIISGSYAQVDENQLGGWYGYLWNTKFNNTQFGLQGDIHYRNWDIAGDLSQLLIRAGVTYTPKNTNLRFTLGYASNTEGAFGEDDETVGENRIYQELTLPQKIGERIYLRHRYRFEQRFSDDQDFRSRYRYALFMSIPFNKTDLSKNAIYGAIYNELFINGQDQLGEREVGWFNQHRISAMLGYSLSNNLRVQAGWMMQTTNSFQKSALTVTLHHKIGRN
jgi:hypothetical protein